MTEANNFNFDEIIDRHGTSCLKYDFAVERGYPKDILPFWVADMDFRTPQPVIDALVKASQFGIFGYTDPKESYKQVLVDWYTKRHGWTPKTDDLVMTPGVVFAIAIAINTFTNPGDAVLIQNPVYYPFTDEILQNDRRLVDSSLKLKDMHYEIDFDDFENKIVSEKIKLFLLCNPHNPGGRVYTREELARLGEICLKHNVIILSDEIHGEFVYAPHKHTPIASISKELSDITITCTAPSKTFNLAGLQCSNIFISNPKLRESFKSTMAKFGYSQPNTMAIVAAEAAFKYGEPWLDALLAYLQKNIDRSIEFLNRELPKVKVMRPEGTYLLWIDFSEYGLSDEELDDIIIHKANLWLDSGHIFGNPGSKFQRINLAEPWSVVENGLKHLAAAFKDR